MVFMPHWPHILGSKPIDLGLERIENLLDKLGNPQDKLPPVIHLAGTNGKGSTQAFLKAIFTEAKLKVHCYTSPHINDFNERIVLNGSPISDGYLHDILEECRIAAENNNIKLTFFEGTTAAAFLAFSRVEADAVILETGLGGRLDATNLVKKPLATIITPISLDHTEYLGPTLELIAGEKVGILKPKIPCISSLQYEEVENVIERKANELSCPLFAFGYDWIVEKNDDGFTYKSQDEDVIFPTPNLYGDHQIINAGTAIATVKSQDKFDISNEVIATAIQKAVWPARMQNIKSGNAFKYLSDDWEIWLDGAHNDAAAHNLASLIEDWEDKPTYIIMGMTRGRDVKKFLSFFENKVAEIATVLVTTEPSAISAEKISEDANIAGFKATPYDSLEDIFYTLGNDKKPGRILICGSLYLASDFNKLNKGTF